MTPRTLRAAGAALAAGAAALLLPAAAGAFGTIDGHMGQHAEHEKITRVLACGATDGVERCFEPLSIDQLAGRKGTLGGVGIPDNPAEILDHPEAHCDDGDYLPGEPYATQDARRARGAIAACVAHFEQRIEEALAAAGGLVDADGTVVARAADMTTDCRFALTAIGGSAGNAKCQVLNGLGRALHTAEDFWSHSNWADQANPSLPVIFPPDPLPEPDPEPAAEPDGDDPAEPAAGEPDDAADEPAAPSTTVFNVANPLGLRRDALVPFLRYPVPQAQVPTLEEELAGTAPISGCDDSPQQVQDWANHVRRALGRGEVTLCADRVGHSHLNKDKGVIDPVTGETSDPDPGTPRGLVGDGFQRAVSGARAQARAVWSDFGVATRARYGDERGAAILRALVRDTPWTSCDVSGAARPARSAPSGSASGALRAVEATVDNRTGERLACEATVLDGGQWASLPPDAIGAGAQGRFRVESQVSGASAPLGRATYAIGQTGYAVQVAWENPFTGFNRMSCQIVRDGAPVTGGPYRCATQGGGGSAARPTYVVTR